MHQAQGRSFVLVTLVSRTWKSLKYIPKWCPLRVPLSKHTSHFFLRYEKHRAWDPTGSSRSCLWGQRWIKSRVTEEEEKVPSLLQLLSGTCCASQMADRILPAHKFFFCSQKLQQGGKEVLCPTQSVKNYSCVPDRDEVLLSKAALEACQLPEVQPCHTKPAVIN